MGAARTSQSKPAEPEDALQVKYAEFMHKVGTIKEAPASWKDLFFPEIHDKAGS